MSRPHRPGTVEIDGQGRAYFVEPCGRHVPYDRERHHPRPRRPWHRTIPADTREFTL